MKCLSVNQPWATLIMLGHKQYETRTWSTRYRGPLAIHASKQFPEAAAQLCQTEPFRTLLREAGFHHGADLPRGRILGTVQLLDCVPVRSVLATLSEKEKALGDFLCGRHVLRLGQPLPLERPIMMTGKLGLFDLPALAS
jgi:hypothetical protein